MRYVLNLIPQFDYVCLTARVSVRSARENSYRTSNGLNYKDAMGSYCIGPHFRKGKKLLYETDNFSCSFDEVWAGMN